MTIIQLNKKFYNIPTAWNELTQQQLLEVMKILFFKNYNAHQIVLKLLKVVTGLNNYGFFRCKPEELQEYFYLLAFLLKEEIEFTKNLIPSYDGFHGPADDITNVRMNEFDFCEDLFLKWFENKEDTDTLNELVAILYRPAKKDYDFLRNPDGDPREAFNQFTCAYNAKSFISHWPLEVKFAIGTWYAGCRRQLVINNQEVFAGGDSGDPAKYGMVDIMLSVAEDGVFGTFAEVEEQYVNLVMMELNRTVTKAKKLEQPIT